MVQQRVCCCFEWPWDAFHNFPWQQVPLLFDMGSLKCEKMNCYRWRNRNHHDVRFQKALRICYDDHIPNLARTLFNQKVIKQFQDGDLTYLVYTKKTSGKFTMHYNVARHLSKHVPTSERSEFSLLKKEQDERERSPPLAMKLQRTSFNRFATFGGSWQCIQRYFEVFEQVVSSEAEWLEDAHVAFLLQLEYAYSKNFELPFLKSSHHLGVVESNMYETWYEGYMQLIRRWLVNLIEFFPQLPSLSNLHKQ